MQRTTIKDMAEMLKVNPSTVSRALKDHPDIGPEMRQAVKDLASKLNYHPNFQAINFRKRRSGLIGLVIPEISMFFFPSVIRAIESIARQKGFNLLVLQSNDDVQREMENVNLCYDSGVDGLLVSLSKTTRDIAHFEQLAALDVPIVFFDKVTTQSDFPRIVIDDRLAAYKAVKYLVETGCQHIVGVFGNPNLSISQSRQQGFLDALGYSSPMQAPNQILYANSVEEARSCILAAFARGIRPDGIFGMSDETLAGIVPALKQSGVRIPEECSVIGISDGHIPQFFDPPLSFVEHSGYKVGYTAVTALCALIAGETLPMREMVLETNLVLQGSTR